MLLLLNGGKLGIQPGEYKIIAVASSQGKIIDTDEYLLTVTGEKKFDYRLVMIIMFAFVVMVITLLSLIR